MNRTDQQIIDAIAKVMGWHKVPAGQPFRDGVIPLSQDAFFDADNKFVMLVQEFDPLHDYNHAALARAKMRERRWAVSYKHTGDKNHNHIWLYYKVGYGECRGLIIAEGCGSNKNELRAEMLAILEAVEKETK